MYLKLLLGAYDCLGLLCYLLIYHYAGTLLIANNIFYYEIYFVRY